MRNHDLKGVDDARPGVCSVFPATTYSQRERLGDLVTTWLHEHSDPAVVSVTVSQSSDAEFHCLSIVACYYEWHVTS
jgi:hypothetical protein